MTKKCEVCLQQYCKTIKANISFHRWPATLLGRRKWLEHLGLASVDINKSNLFICSDHFLDSEFEIKIVANIPRRFLKKSANPLRTQTDKNGPRNSISTAIEPETITAASLVAEIPTDSSDCISEVHTIPSTTDLFLTCLEKRAQTDKSYPCQSTSTAIESKTITPASFEAKLLVAKLSPEPYSEKHHPSSSSASFWPNLEKSAQAEKSRSSSTCTATGSESRTITATSIDTESVANSSGSISGVHHLSSTAGSFLTTLRKRLRSLEEGDVFEVVQEMPLKKSAQKVQHEPPSKEKAFRKRYVGELNITDFSTPRKAKRNWLSVKNEITSLKLKIRRLHRKNQYLSSKVKSLNSLVKILTDKHFISEGAQETLKGSVGGEQTELVLKKLLIDPKKQKYDPCLRSFAMTLHFYSPKGYEYVRNTFNKSLPHPITISKWYRKINGEPGFTEESLRALEMKTASSHHKIVCSLVVDEMAIRKKMEWDGKKYYGFVNFGCKIISDILPEATEAFVFMLVGVNANWKIPIGYFLIKGLTGSEKANLVKQALKFVHETGVEVCSLTFDGAASNISMVNQLGAQISDIHNLKTYFLHPVTNGKIFIIMDACHMVKLIRNCLGEYEILETKEKKQVCWQYLKNLLDIQEQEGLTAANKLKRRHIHYFKEKMKVKLAAQTLSRSVADALAFMREDTRENVKQKFTGSEETELFLHLMNDLFDIFNTKGRFATYEFKRALSSKNEVNVFKRLKEIKQYIHNLTYCGKPIVQSGRKCGFIGMLVNIESIQELNDIYVRSENAPLKYLPTYKLSQDHLELFFCAIRSRGGHNNNPTCKQFESAYKKLLIHVEIKNIDSGNAVAMDSTSILHCSSATREITKDNYGENQLFFEEHKNIVRDIENMDFITSSAWHLTIFTTDVVSYISGFVALSLSKCLSCLDCLNLLVGDNTESLLQSIKTYDKATMCNASPLVIKLCTLAEKSFRVISNEINIFNPKIKNIYTVLINATMKNLPSNFYDLFGNHVFDVDPLSDHINNFTKLILKKYFNIRIHHETVKRLDKNIGGRVRSMLTKTILFKHQ